MGKQIVFSHGCTWWDDKEKALIPEGRHIPVCPHCQSVLFEQDEDVWLDQINKYNENNPGYSDFMNWLKGKCFTGTITASKAYFKERG